MKHIKQVKILEGKMQRRRNNYVQKGDDVKGYSDVKAMVDFLKIVYF